VRFSPDGRYLLAQDDGGITVLTRTPLEPKFHIETDEAVDPQFTPDSSAVVFHTSTLRVERWAIATERLAAVHEVFVRAGCLEATLSPDGTTLGCLDTNFDLNVIDVASGDTRWLVKKFYTADPALGFLRNLMTGRTRLVHMGFSPDGRYLAAGFYVEGFPGRAPTRDGVAIYDGHTRSGIEAKGAVRTMMADGFVFTGPNELIAFNRSNATRSARIRLPFLEAVGESRLYQGNAVAAAKGPFVLIRPLQADAAVVVDTANNAIVKRSSSSALDVYDDVIVSERISGALSLQRLSDGTDISSVALPRASIGRLDGAAVSSDLKWLALSGPARGAVWDLSGGTRQLHVSGFRGGFFDERNWFYADFRKTPDEARRISRFDTQSREFTHVLNLVDDYIDQAGPALMARAPHPNGGMVLEARDVRDSSTLWTTTYGPDLPEFFPSDRGDTMVLAWPASSRTAREEAKKTPALARQLAALKSTKGDYFLQVVDVKSGAVKGALVIETGQASFEIVEAISAGDWVAIAEPGNRVLVYSLSTGELKGHAFGNRAVIAPATGLLKVTNGDAAVAIYDLATMQRRDDFTFVHPVALTWFDRDGRRLLVVTRDHTAFIIDVSKAGAGLARAQGPTPRARFF
jgi:hypothetical protein